MAMTSEIETIDFVLSLRYLMLCVGKLVDNFKKQLGKKDSDSTRGLPWRMPLTRPLKSGYDLGIYNDED